MNGIKRESEELDDVFAGVVQVDRQPPVPFG